MHHLWAPGQAAESPDLRDRVGSEQQDAVAESRFAWGELRQWPPAVG